MKNKIFICTFKYFYIGLLCILIKIHTLYMINHNFNGFCKNVLFLLYPSMGKVLESVSRQARLQRVLGQRLRNPWTQLKSHIVVFNQVEFQHVTVLPKITWGLVQGPKSAIFSFSSCGCMYVCMYVCGRFFRPRFFPHC